MKKKIVLSFLMIMLFACLLVISASAAGPKDLFSEVTILDNINKTTTFGYGETDYARVVLVDPTDSTKYITYPTYYIFDIRNHSTEGNQPIPNFTYLNSATGRTGTTGEFKAEHIVCFELCESFTGVSTNYTKTNTMTNLQLVRFSKNMTIIHASAFKGLANLSVVEFESNMTESASLNITSYAFDNCDSIVSVDLPRHLKKLGERAFGDNEKLETVSFAEGTDFTIYDKDGNVTNNTLYASFINDPALKSIRLPEGITSTGILTCSGCTSLEYVYIPESCKSIDDGAFNNCKALKTIEFAPNCQLERVGAKGIAESSAIETIIFPNSLIEAAGEAPIRNLTNLKFINFGASFTGFTGYAGMYSTNNTNLVIVLSDTFNLQYKDQLPTNATILYTGTKTQAESFGYAKTQSYEEWVKEGSPKNDKRIVYGYNRCEAFYKGLHVEEVEDNNPCVVTDCKNCDYLNKYAGNESTHDFVSAYAYANYFENGVVKSTCQNEGCIYHGEGNAKVDNETLKPIFTSIQYSTKEDSKSFGIYVEYKIDQEAVASYKTITGVDLNYGVVAIAKSNTSSANPLNVDGSTSASNIIAANVTSTKLNTVKLIVTGDWAGNSAVEIYMLGYITNGTELQYVGSQTTTVEGEAVSVAATSTSTATLNVVTYANMTGEKE